MHGIPAQFVLFERRNVSGTWKIVTHGDAVAAGVRYKAEGLTEINIEADDPSWYLVFAQVATGGASTRLEIVAPTAGLFLARREWNAFTFPQIDTVTASGSGTADPTWTTLTRTFSPFMHAAAFWILQTTATPEVIRLQIAAGVSIATQPLLFGIWKLHNANEPQTQPANLLGYDAAYTLGGFVAATALNAMVDPFWSPFGDAVRLRVTASADSGSNLIQWLTNATFREGRPNSVSANYTHELKVKIASHAGESTTGSVRVIVTRTDATTPVDSILSYGPTETVTTFAIAATAATINTVSVTNIDAADRFEIEVSLNVTN